MPLNKRINAYLRERLKDIPLTIFMSLFALFCLSSITYSIVVGKYRDIVVGFLYLAIVPVFYFAEFTLKARVPLAYSLFLLVFVTFCHLGASYNFYTYIPRLDDILHAAWGVVFSTIGIILIKGLMGAPKTVKAVIAHVLFGVGFAMLMSILWEIIEFCGDILMPEMDMQEDTIVDHIHSFILHEPYDHQHTWRVEDIVKTVIVTADGTEYVIEGGYLDIGLVDTMHDLLWCTGSTAVFSVLLAADWCTKKLFYRHFIPQLIGEKYDKHGKPVINVPAEVAEEEVSAEAAVTAEAVKEEENSAQPSEEKEIVSEENVD